MHGMVLIIIGLLLGAIDINVPMGISYDKYISSPELGGVFQEYVIGNMVGTKAMFDVLPDILGYFLIAIGIYLLTKYGNKLLISYPFLGLVIAKTIIIPCLPFLYNGKALCYSVLFLTFLGVITEILMEYFLVKGLIKMTSVIQNERNNVAVRIGWLISIACKTVIFVTGFVGINFLTYVYGTVYIVATIFYCFKLFKSKDYLGITADKV